MIEISDFDGRSVAYKANTWTGFFKIKTSFKNPDGVIMGISQGYNYPFLLEKCYLMPELIK